MRVLLDEHLPIDLSRELRDHASSPITPDNPAGGGCGDIFEGFVEAGVESGAFHAICDPEAVQQGMRAGVGAKTTMTLGGGPLSLTGEVVCLTNGRFIAYGPMGGGVERNYGPSMVFRVGGIDIIVIINNGQAYDLEQFISLDPTRYRTVAVKSMQYFRAAFEPIARDVVLVDTSAPPILRVYTPELSTKVRRPVWPLDPIPDPRTP